jgi:hypothetical protein
MNYTKILILTLIVLATISGTWAFEVNKIFGEIYCVLTTVGNPDGGICTSTFINSKTATTGSRYWYATWYTDQCNQYACNVSTSFRKE